MTRRRQAGAISLVVALVACAPDVQRAAVDEGAVAPTSDTVVRRVTRLTRQPWMIQRATGVVRARRALEPLDSVLVLRVLDQRGAEMGGVRVRWTQVNPASGARMRVLNAVTDSLGLSRVEFTPGLTASAQGVRAEVADVAHLDFLVRIPVGAIRVIPDQAAIWSGEWATFGVELRDSTGRELSGGVVSWKSADTAVFAIAPADSLHGRAVGRLAGAARVVASVDSARGFAAVTVKPVLNARFVTLGGAPAPAMRLDVVSDALRERMSSESGQFTAKLNLPLHGDVELRAVPVGDSAHHSVHIRVTSSRELQDLVIALIPTWWTIDAGSYAGQTVAIDAVGALRRTATSGGFWRVAPMRGGNPRQILGWRSEDFPLRLAFDRRRSNEAIASADSVAFWAAAEQMERDLGARLLAPADLPAEWRGGEVVPVEIGLVAAEGHTSVTWSERGDAYDAVVSFRRAATLRDAHIVTHELLHLLGFGHTTAWRSVVVPTSGRETRLSAEDVAHAQLAMRMRRLRGESGARPGLPGLP